MQPNEIVAYDGQVAEITFNDGTRIQAHIVDVDPQVRANNVLYQLLAVRGTADTPRTTLRLGAFLAASAEDISGIEPTDGQSYLRAPGAPASKAVVEALVRSDA